MRGLLAERCTESQDSGQYALMPCAESEVRNEALSRVAALEVSVAWESESCVESVVESSGKRPPLLHGATSLQRRSGTRGSGSSALLSCIDDALRSLDEAITAEDETEENDVLVSEARVSPSVGKDIRENSNSALALVETRTSVRSHFSSASAEDGRLRREQLRRLSRLEPGTRWLYSILQSCIQERQSVALHRLELVEKRPPHLVSASALRSRDYSSSSCVKFTSFAVILSGAIRSSVKSTCRSAFHQWYHRSQIEGRNSQLRISSMLINDNQTSCSTPGGVRRVVATIEQRQSIPAQLAAIEAENRWLRRAAHLERLVQRSLVHVALALQQTKADGFRALKFNAIRASAPPSLSFCSVTSPLIRRRPIAKSPVEYDARSRMMSARRIGCVFTQVQLRLASQAWQRLAEHRSLRRRHDYYGVGPNGLVEFGTGQRQAWRNLAAEEGFDLHDLGLNAFTAPRSSDSPCKWVWCGPNS